MRRLTSTAYTDSDTVSGCLHVKVCLWSASKNREGKEEGYWKWSPCQSSLVDKIFNGGIIWNLVTYQPTYAWYRYICNKSSSADLFYFMMNNLVNKMSKKWIWAQLILSFGGWCHKKNLILIYIGQHANISLEPQLCLSLVRTLSCKDRILYSSTIMCGLRWRHCAETVNVTGN